MDSNDSKEVKDGGEARGSTEPAPVDGCTEQQAGEVAGGTGDCPTTYTITIMGSSVTGPVPGANFITGAYEGAIEAMSHAMERVSNAVNQ